MDNSSRLHSHTIRRDDDRCTLEMLESYLTHTVRTLGKPGLGEWESGGPGNFRGRTGPLGRTTTVMSSPIQVDSTPPVAATIRMRSPDNLGSGGRNLDPASCANFQYRHKCHPLYP